MPLEPSNALRFLHEKLITQALTNGSKNAWRPIVPDKSQSCSYKNKARKIPRFAHVPFLLRHSCCELGPALTRLNKVTPKRNARCAYHLDIWGTFEGHLLGGRQGSIAPAGQKALTFMVRFQNKTNSSQHECGGCLLSGLACETQGHKVAVWFTVFAGFHTLNAESNALSCQRSAMWRIADVNGHNFMSACFGLHWRIAQSRGLQSAVSRHVWSSRAMEPCRGINPCGSFFHHANLVEESTMWIFLHSSLVQEVGWGLPSSQGSFSGPSRSRSKLLSFCRPPVAKSPNAECREVSCS